MEVDEKGNHVTAGDCVPQCEVDDPANDCEDDSNKPYDNAVKQNEEKPSRAGEFKKFVFEKLGLIEDVFESLKGLVKDLKAPE